MIAHTKIQNREHDMNNRLFLTFLMSLIPGLVCAEGSETYQCTYGDLQRRVEILRETAAQVPCEVHYYKDSEAPGERQVLWSATNEVGYCENNAEELVAKLEGWGWDCGQGEAQESMPAEPDDTEALTTDEESETEESE